jgi:hypothetical protein
MQEIFKTVLSGKFEVKRLTAKSKRRCKNIETCIVLGYNVASSTARCVICQINAVLSYSQRQPEITNKNIIKLSRIRHAGAN